MTWPARATQHPASSPSHPTTNGSPKACLARRNAIALARRAAEPHTKNQPSAEAPACAQRRMDRTRSEATIEATSRIEPVGMLGGILAVGDPRRRFQQQPVRSGEKRSDARLAHQHQAGGEERGPVAEARRRARTARRALARRTPCRLRGAAPLRRAGGTPRRRSHARSPGSRRRRSGRSRGGCPRTRTHDPRRPP